MPLLLLSNISVFAMMNDGHDAWMLLSDTYKSSVIKEVDGIVKLWKMIRNTSKTEFHNRHNQQFAVDFCNAAYSIFFFK